MSFLDGRHGGSEKDYQLLSVIGIGLQSMPTLTSPPFRSTESRLRRCTASGSLDSAIVSQQWAFPVPQTSWRVVKSALSETRCGTAIAGTQARSKAKRFIVRPGDQGGVYEGLGALQTDR